MNVRFGFRHALESYRENRDKGDKEHRRKTDVAAGSISPQKLYGVPVGLMFFEGAPRLVKAGITIPYLQLGDPERTVIEAYPGVLARQIIGRRKYKNDTKSKQTMEQRKARYNILNNLSSESFNSQYGIKVEAPDLLCEDPTGDHIDALLCAIQAAWAWKNRANKFGAPLSVDPLEGWIADPTVSKKSF